MAWKETNVVEQRKKFVIKALAEDKAFSALCREFDVCRRIGKKWVERFLAEGEKGLCDKPKTPKSNARSPSLEMVLKIVSIRQTTGWGCGRNIRVVLGRAYPPDEVPSARTIDRILKSAGLVEARKKRRVHQSERIQRKVDALAPNDVWTTDFKGWWFTQDKRKCQPLTLRDEFSRFLLTVQGMPTISWEAVQESMCESFKRYGVPKAIRSDNGSPFAASNSLLGLTKLSAWWVALGIALDRTDPGRPDQNGGHERMHRDLKRQLQRQPEADLPTQQRAFEEWRKHFNEVRPHSALAMQTPASVYKESKTNFLGKRFELEYPAKFEVRKVSKSGWIKRRSKTLFVSGALSGWELGLEQLDDNQVNLWFAGLCLGQTDGSLMHPIRKSI